MQPVSTQFTQQANGDWRKLSWQVRWSPKKEFDDDVHFFTLNQSLLNGPDLLAPSGTNVVQQWDKYEYEDITDRVIAIETEGEQLEPYSVVQGMADLVLNNYDDYFTPNSSSPINSYIRPRRPFRILLGFGGEVVPVFIGLSDGMPRIDRRSKTATFHCVDFLTYLFDQEIDRTITLQDYSTGEILEYILLYLGLLPSQFSLDSTSFNRIPFFFIEKGDKFGKIARELMQAEQGRLWMDESGVIRFLNRQNYPSTAVKLFNEDNTINWSNSNESDIINIARIESDVLEEQPLQSIWESAEELVVTGSRDVWVDLEDPATGVNTPTQQAEEIEDSYFIANTAMSVAMTVFSKSVLLEFTGDGVISNIVLWGTPIRVVDTITAEYSDSDSIEDFEEQVYEFKTTYIQRPERAISLARTMVLDYKDYGSIVELEVKDNPALQIGDVVVLDLEGYTGNYTISKIQNRYATNTRQKLIVKKREPIKYFILNESLLNGGDLLL